MTSEEFLESNPTITYIQAQALLMSHGISLDDFLHDFGRQHEYDTATILTWIGY